MIEAKVIADSLSPSGVRLSTLQLCYPRFIHSEFMTHRQFSRNASSSRAVPVTKMINQILDETALPIHWGKNQRGMQAREEMDEMGKRWTLNAWMAARDRAIQSADTMIAAGAHKQIVNRILEPYQHIHAVVTATEWDNFFKLRDHEDAQPEIRALAVAMREAMEQSNPRLLHPGEYHTPYGFGDTLEEQIKTSVAGCARVSYLTHDGTDRLVEKDVELYNQLLAAGHMSPFEHVATPMDLNIVHASWYTGNVCKGVTHIDRNNHFWSGNFRGWIQYRQLVA